MSVNLAPRAMRGDDVGAVHDAGVDHHLGVVADLAHDVRQQVERDRRAVELATAVVGEQDAVDAEVGEALASLRGSARP